MMHLIRAEFDRLRTRRTIVLLLLAMVLAPIAIGIATTIDQEIPRGDPGSRATAQAAEEAKKPYVAEQLADCMADPASFGVREGQDVDAKCTEYVVPQPEWFFNYDYLDLEVERNESGLGACLVACMIAMLIGTTFVGHDWNTGSMSNQLLFEPRRTRTWFVKAASATTLVGLAALLGLSGFWLMIASGFWTADVPIKDGLLLGSLEQGWRGALVAAVACWLGFAITMLSRSTVFTLGLLLALSLGGSVLIGALFANPGPIDPTISAKAVIQSGTTYYVDETACSPDGDCDYTRTRSLWAGLIYTGVLTAGVSTASLASYRRRDI